MERIDELIARKRSIYLHYQEHLGSLPGIAMNPEKPGTVNGYWMPTAVFAPELGITREQLLDKFAQANIDARVFFYPLSSLPMFSEAPHNRVAYDLPGRAINLPSYHELTEADQDRVIAVITQALHD